MKKIAGVCVTAALIALAMSGCAPERGASAAPSAAPSAAASALGPQAWADKTYGTFAVVHQAGSGSSVIDLPSGASAGIVTATYSGTANFIVNVLDKSGGATADLLVNALGTYSGSTAYGVRPLSKGGVKLQILTNGKWTLTISPMSSAGEVPATGIGNGVFIHAGAAGSLLLAHKGAGNFFVNQYSARAESTGALVDTSGPYSGTASLGEGPTVITFTAAGDWSAAPK